MINYILLIIFSSGFSAPSVHHIEFNTRIECEIAKAVIQKDFNYNTKVYCLSKGKQK